MLPVKFGHKHTKLSKYELLAYYQDYSCCARPLTCCESIGCVAAGAGWGGADRSQISRMAISIDLAKSGETDATHSQLWQSMDPPLGSDLHYDDK